MISATLYNTLDAEERRLWHSHAFEVKSGMLIMPGPQGLPTGLWEEAETKEMEDVVGLYGKTYHFWQVDRGDKLPLGQPELMMSFTNENQISAYEGKLEERDKRYGVSSQGKKAKRGYVPEPEIHEGRPCCCYWHIRQKLTMPIQMQTTCGKRQRHRNSRSRSLINKLNRNTTLLSSAQTIHVYCRILSPSVTTY